MQFEPPRWPGGIAGLIRTLISNLNSTTESLVVCNDWGFDHPDEMAVINAMRLGFGGTSRLGLRDFSESGRHWNSEGVYHSSVKPIHSEAPFFVLGAVGQGIDMASVCW
jgi:hypothetical protein